MQTCRFKDNQSPHNIRSIGALIRRLKKYNTSYLRLWRTTAAFSRGRLFPRFSIFLLSVVHYHPSHILLWSCGSTGSAPETSVSINHDEKSGDADSDRHYRKIFQMEFTSYLMQSSS